MPACPECDRPGDMHGLCIVCVRRFAGPEGVFPDSARKGAEKWLGYPSGLRRDGSVDRSVDNDLAVLTPPANPPTPALQVFHCHLKEDERMLTPELIAASLRAAADVLDGGAAPGSPTGGAKPPKNKPAPPPADDDADDDDGPTYDEVSALVVRLSKEKGRDVAVNFLKTFKGANKKPCTKGAEILPADYAKAKADAEALLEEDDDLT